jgi:hypothetical protein
MKRSKAFGNPWQSFHRLRECERRGPALLTQVGLPRLGKWHELRSVIDQHAVEEVIIAVDSGEHEHISRIMNELEGTGVRIKVIPDMYDILSGSVKMTSIFGTPLIEVNPEIMPAWQFSLKRIMDLGISAIAMVVLARCTWYSRSRCVYQALDRSSSARARRQVRSPLPNHQVPKHVL